MTEVFEVPIQKAETAYFDNIGNPMTPIEYYEYEVHEADRYLKGLEKKEDYIRLPGSILSLIAAYGQPGLTDVYIRFTTWYAHLDNLVLNSNLSELQSSRLVTQTIASPEMHLNSLERKGDSYYSLTAKAYEFIPNLYKIIELRQAANRGNWLGKNALAPRVPKHKLDVTSSRS